MIMFTHDLEKTLETVTALKKRGVKQAKYGIILGTGLGRLTESMTQKVSVSFEDCPHFPRATSIGHSGNWVYGKLHGQSVIVMEGRFHTYEGYSMQQVTYPIRVMKAMGVKQLFISNAAGGMNPRFGLGDLMLVDDHINFMGDSPLVGSNDDRLGPRFPDMCAPYDERLLALAEKTADRIKATVHRGVYVGVKGPQLETKAEYRFLRQMGADAVGMSTIPEVIVAVHAGLRVLAVSCITDMCLPDALEPVDIEKILKTARKSEPVLTKLFSEIIRAQR